MEKGVTFSTVATLLLKVSLLDGCFPRIIYCTNGAKARKSSNICTYLPVCNYSPKLHNFI